MSKTNEPVAWAVTPTGKDEEVDCEFVFPSAATAGDVALGCDGVVVPLYREPQPTLTSKEREAVKMGISSCEQIGQYQAWADRINEQAAATLRGLLERLGGGR